MADNTKTHFKGGKKSTESPVRQIKGGRGPCTVIGKCFFSVSHTVMFLQPVSLFWTSKVQTRSQFIIGLVIKIFCRTMSPGGNVTTLIFAT